MYTSFFGFKENPFDLTPDPQYLFLSHYHKEALDHLLYGINERKGFIVITGGIGTGKTTLCRALLNYLDDSTKSALIFSAFISDTELLKTINQEFGINTGPAAGTKKDYLDALNGFLIDTFRRGGNAVLLIDEAQNLSHNVLEQIRMLSNLETEKEKLLQIVLMGQSELKGVLAAPSLKQLNERITIRYDLSPLDREDVPGYVNHRLMVAGGSGNPVITNAAYKKVYSYSRGNPRRINAAFDRALLIAYAKGKNTISKKIVGKAIKDVCGYMTAGSISTGLSIRKISLVTICIIFLIILAGLAGWHLREDMPALLPLGQTTSLGQATGVLPEPRRPDNTVEDLFLDEQISLARLFGLFTSMNVENGLDADGMHLSLFSFDLEPEYYVMIKRPFRVLAFDLPDNLPAFPRYLLIREATETGAIATDHEGEEHTVTRDFILRHWGRKISFVYPYKNKTTDLIKGMASIGVLEIQKKLNNIGYLIEPTGIYDDSTFFEVMKFQRDFGLKADGIAGPRTMAVLYLMAD
ncbi:MAG: AAA family ATPase [Thermodesulfobacteriota bacterium]|nr:AAA family ATPase [Thermodesulfobacteriota bacterium]